MRTITRTHNVISAVFITIIIVITISLIMGCKTEVILGDIKIIKPVSSEPMPSVYVTKTYDVSVSVTTKPEGLSLEYVWGAASGKISPLEGSDLSDVKYAAPDSEGTDTITLTVKSKGATIASKMLAVRVIEPYPLDRDYIPSGYMGDVKSIKKEEVVIDDRPCFKFSYKPGPEGWGAVYFQFPPNNWGEKPGKNLDKGYTKIEFKAKGEAGGEIITFRALGIPDNSKEINSTTPEVLEDDNWKTCTLDLRDGDLSNVIGAWGWMATTEVTFYIARPIYYK